MLDVFQPEIFERDINAMIEASKSKAARKAEGTTLGFWERHRLLKEAKSLLRVGAQVENLHDALQVVARQAEQWRVFVPHGGWPVLPPHLDDIIDTQEQLAADLTALDTVLATTPSGGDLQSLDLNQVETRLKALYDDRLALDTLPERCRLERDFQTVGLGELVGDLNARRWDVDAVDGELQLAWWTTVFEDIVRSSAIISNQDGLAMQAAADRFVQVDIEHVRSAGPMVGAGDDPSAVRYAVRPHPGGESAAHHVGGQPQGAVESHPPRPCGDLRGRQAGAGGHAGRPVRHHGSRTGGRCGGDRCGGPICSLWNC